jgi:hypothetical protein
VNHTKSRCRNSYVRLGGVGSYRAGPPGRAPPITGGGLDVLDHVTGILTAMGNWVGSLRLLPLFLVVWAVAAAVMSIAALALYSLNSYPIHPLGVLATSVEVAACGTFGLCLRRR